ncbi:hypothetical protein EYC84_007232 [Monilinia fructicola]|uniref:Uncharacterized protein n=1 Tax=Monilinia fructicola TaxID=38448 RepID=A0A5M9K8Q6_MONFR|nr:hypothetical protein EYC84_007232 [Monilinia fructicola]
MGDLKIYNIASSNIKKFKSSSFNQRVSILIRRPVCFLGIMISDSSIHPSSSHPSSVHFIRQHNILCHPYSSIHPTIMKKLTDRNVV